MTDWLRLRQALWPDVALAEHEEEAAAILADYDGMVAFIASDGDEATGFAEAALRHDYVNGCNTSPVAFLEGVYVDPAWRNCGIGQALVEAVADWAMALGVHDLASDADAGDIKSHGFHRAAGFAETERVVFFRRGLTPSPPGSPPPPPPGRPRPAEGSSPPAA